MVNGFSLTKLKMFRFPAKRPFIFTEAILGKISKIPDLSTLKNDGFNKKCIKRF